MVCHEGSENRAFLLALAISIGFHALLFCIKLTTPAGETSQEAGHSGSRVAVTLQPQTTPFRQRAETGQDKPRSNFLTAKPGSKAATEQAPAWSQAERDDINRFLDELTVASAPRRGRELAQAAVEMAGKIAVQQEDDELNVIAQKLENARVDPFSVEMYFDALFRKMNRSAVMISSERRTRGSDIAAVRVAVNQDGSVRGFRVLWAGDQQAEIDFIKAVVDMAAPFPVFPDDVRRATDAVILQICIFPASQGSGGPTFTRMAEGRTCQPR